MWLLIVDPRIGPHCLVRAIVGYTVDHGLPIIALVCLYSQVGTFALPESVWVVGRTEGGPSYDVMRVARDFARCHDGIDAGVDEGVEGV